LTEFVWIALGIRGGQVDASQHLGDGVDEEAVSLEASGVQTYRFSVRQ
jgi:hypothetical protein